MEALITGPLGEWHEFNEGRSAAFDGQLPNTNPYEYPSIAHGLWELGYLVEWAVDGYGGVY